MLRRLIAVFTLPVLALPVLAQHDISKVDPAPPGTAIATPLPEDEQRRLRGYDIPELAGARQALGSQLIDGRLPRPLIDFITQESSIQQRLSIFEGGLVVIDMTGASTIRKKVILPESALEAYLSAVSPDQLQKIDARSLAPPERNRRSVLRVYRDDGTHVERAFHPSRILPKALGDQLGPLRDLLRAMSEDRTVTSTLAGYEPQPGDELVADDQKIYRVERVIGGAGVVELRCLEPPTTIFVMKNELHLYFVGAKPK